MFCIFLFSTFEMKNEFVAGVMSRQMILARFDEVCIGDHQLILYLKHLFLGKSQEDWRPQGLEVVERQPVFRAAQYR